MLIWGEDKWRMYKDCLYYHYSIVSLYMYHYICIIIYIVSLYILLLFANSYVNLRIFQNKTDASGSCTELMLKASGPHKTPKCLRSYTSLSYHLLPNTIAVTITHHQEMACTILIIQLSLHQRPFLNSILTRKRMKTVRRIWAWRSSSLLLLVPSLSTLLVSNTGQVTDTPRGHILSVHQY